MTHYRVSVFSDSLGESLGLWADGAFPVQKFSARGRAEMAEVTVPAVGNRAKPR
jgi:hypothetical protein